ncbi:hypothetical protein EIP86_005744 [Pleurotus ostreatoroseus]|nr:hypothetical protein EIP86_005744 [Pleurotus ostreatoroseus]
MTTFQDGDYAVSNLAYASPVGETSQPADGVIGFPLPYRVVLLTKTALSPMASNFRIRKWDNQRNTSGDLYEIKIGDNVTHLASGNQVLAQKDQVFGWKLEQLPDQGPNVYTIGYKSDNTMLFWHVASGNENASVELKTPQQGATDLSGYLFTLEPSKVNQDEPEVHV